MRGVLSGAFWGVVVGGGAIVITSLAAEPPVVANIEEQPVTADADASVDAPQIVADVPQEPQPPIQSDAPEPQVAPADPVAQIVAPEPIVEAVVPDVPAPQPVGTEPADPVVEITPEAPTQTDEPTIVLQDPETPQTDLETAFIAPDVSAVPNAPVITETAPQIETPAVNPVAPDVAQAPVIQSNPAAPLPPVSDVAAPDVPVVAADPKPAIVPEPVIEAPVVQQEPQIIPEAPAPVIVAEATEPDTNNPAQEPTPAEIVAEPAQSAEVKVNRLFQDASDAPATRPTTSPAPSSSATALDRFAAPFAAPADTPVMSVLIVGEAGNVAAITDLPFPVTVVLDPAAPNAAETMRSYRDAGIEVGLSTSLPSGATPSDVEVSYEAAFSALPESVILFDGAGSSLQANRAVMAQAVEGLSARGRGLIAVEEGLNNILRSADQAGVPARGVYRNLTDDAGNARAIARTMEQAAFRARQEDGIVVVAPGDADTLAALADWYSGQVNRGFALAPVTTILPDAAQ